MALGDVLFIVLAAIVSVPSVILALEVFAAILPRRTGPVPCPDPRPRVAVLIPAHNEVSGIAATVGGLRSQLHSGDRVVVIADNCSDQTAAQAREAGAIAIERFDVDRRGKGFALDFGLKYLEPDPPEIVVLVDADTRAAADAIDKLVAVSHLWQAPSQGVFVDSPRMAGPRQQWSAFALLFKNKVRPLGLHQMGLPCLLYGSGMAFPWYVIRKADLGTGNIVEDMKLGIDLALAGHAPRFCPDAKFESDDAPSLASTATRRTRWEHGHVFTLLTQTPRLLLNCVSQRRPAFGALALELAVPPLSLLAYLQAALLLACLIWWLAGNSFMPALVVAVGMLVAVVAILTAWAFYGRRLLSPRILCLLPIYILWKAPIYLKLVFAPQRKWVRTERKPAA